MNVYQMYIANGNKAGFWIKRDSWSNYKAFVTSVQGKTEGKLKGNHPYYNNCVVRADVYNFRTGELATSFGDGGKNHLVSCAGTFGYELVDGI